MKLSTKIILPIILISALLILLNGCMVVPDDESPGYTPGTITGTIASPCCSTSGGPVAETSGAPEFWCYYCQVTWSLQDGVEVILTYGEDEVATTITNDKGEYTFTDVPPGKNYVITALCPDYEDDRPLVKDVALELVEGGFFDTKTTDIVSTSLGLVVDFLVEYTEWGPEDISLDEVIANGPNFYAFPKFKQLILEVRRVLENCENVDTDEDVQEALCLAAEEISKLDIGCAPGYTPLPGPGPTPGPCDGNAAPVINKVEYDDGTGFKEVHGGDTINVIAGQSYIIRVTATDDGTKDPLTFQPFLDDVGLGTYTYSINKQFTIPTVVGDIGTHTVYIEFYDGCTKTKSGTVTVNVCPPLNEALAITISDNTPCYGTCATISKITVSYTDGVTPNLEILPTYEGKNLTWVVDTGITFNPVDGTVCLDGGEVGVPYEINFTYTDECSGTATATGTATINFNANPIADAAGDYEDDAICGSPATITLDGSGSGPSIIGGSAIVSWEWSETTLGALGSGETLDYDFDAGSYFVTLTVTDGNGCTDTDDADVEITAVCNDLNYLLIRGYNSASGCTGLQETHEETPPDVPHLIETGLWLTDQDHTPNVKHINFVARFLGDSTTIEYRYRHQIQWLANSTPEPWEPWSSWSSSGTDLGEDTYGYGFASDCIYAPSKTSNPKYYCYQFEIEIRVNGDVNTYLINID